LVRTTISDLYQTGDFISSQNHGFTKLTGHGHDARKKEWEFL